MSNGKIEVRPTVPLANQDDLSRAYTPGVADAVRRIADQPDAADSLTGRRNTVVVVSDGSAVLGVGDVGPLAALPVMEGKAALFKAFADIDAWPVCVQSREPDDIVRTVTDISTTVGGINLEDIAAPRCFDIERRLQRDLDIPVFHDDQHGTAIVVLAALTNALTVTDKSLLDVSCVISGAGAAGSAIARLLLSAGATDLVVCDSSGSLHHDRSDIDGEKRWLADHANPRDRSGSVSELVKDADVFIGVSVAGVLDEEDVASMADRAIVFALANPDPEVDPDVAAKHAAVVATGRSDRPNQINNVLVFPGIFRGLLDCGLRDVDEQVQLAAAAAIAGLVGDDVSEDRIVPDVFDERLVPEIARAVQGSTSRS
jgi:malate dehydrogenase (oxaloacetate-decarboxylating)